MSMSTAVLKFIIKNWKLISIILKEVPRDLRRKIIKIAIDILVRNKLPFTTENIIRAIKAIINRYKKEKILNDQTYINEVPKIAEEMQNIEVNSLYEFNEEKTVINVIDNPDDIIDFEEYSAIPNNENLKIKIIFLSGEGVIFKSKFGNLDKLSFIEPSFVAIKKIIEETGASIIITSSLRKRKGGKMLLEMKFKEYGIDKALIGYTVETKGIRRKDKIKDKIRDFEDMIDNYVIFDRRTDLGSKLSTTLISCSNGIDRARMEKSIDILNK